MRYLIPLLLVGCAPNQEYVRADRFTYNAIAPEYAAYVSTDEELTEEQIARRLRLIESWQARVEEAEAGFGE